MPGLQCLSDKKAQHEIACNMAELRVWWGHKARAGGEDLGVSTASTPGSRQARCMSPLLHTAAAAALAVLVQNDQLQKGINSTLNVQKTAPIALNSLACHRHNRAAARQSPPELTLQEKSSSVRQGPEFCSALGPSQITCGINAGPRES